MNVLLTPSKRIFSFLHLEIPKLLTTKPIYIPSLCSLRISAAIQAERRIPDTSDIPELNEPPLKKFYEAYYQTEFGKIYDKKPRKIKCQKGKLYYWCICGWSHDQPFCNGKCILPEMKVKTRPVIFKPKETREYWFCNCKQTKNRPFCDGTHNSPEVQNATSIVKR